MGAFGGSIDKDKSLKQIVIDEVREEAGFDVDLESIIGLGQVMVSTQMNQFCYLFIVIVDRSTQKERQPENEVEALAKIEWTHKSDGLLWNLQDWKPLAIITKALAIGII